MRITAVEVRQLKVPYGPDGYRPSWLPGVRQDVFPQTLIRVFSDQGHVGMASTNCFGEEVLESTRELGPVLLGRRLDNREDLLDVRTALMDRVSAYDEQTMLGITLKEARKKSNDRSISWTTVLGNLLREPTKMGLFRTKNIVLENRFAYLDVALWDLLGRYKDQPIAELLGKQRDRVRAYVSTGEVISERMLEFAEDCHREGFESIKFRVNDPDPDGREFALLERGVKKLGRDFQVGVDANQGWSLLPPYWSRSEALAAGFTLEDLDVDWLEEPLGCLDLEGLKQLSTELDIEIVGGELESGEGRFEELIPVYDTINPDVCMATGITLGKRLAEEAGRQNVGYTPHTWDLGPGVAAGLQLACAVEPCNRLEYPWDPAWPVSYRDSILDAPIEVRDGYLELPEDPGLGVRLDPEAVEEFTVDRHQLGETV